MSIEKNIEVGYISRVEGQGEIKIKIVDNAVEEARFGIFEPPKFFEAFLIGRKYNEVHELTSRICGICPVPHQICALRAIENALKLEVSEQTRKLRMLMNFANHLQSHALNLYLLAAPDYLNHESAISMVETHSHLVKKGLMLKKLGNDLTEAIGGKAIHPVSAVVGGFTDLPSKTTLENLKKRLKNALKDGEETVEFFASVNMPDFERKCEQIALTRKDMYPINDGVLSSTEGLNVNEQDYRKCIKELQADYSWAKHSIVVGRGSFMVGPLSRLNLNFNVLSDKAKAAAEKIGFKPIIYQPFKALMARAIELLNCIEYSLILIDELIPLKNEVVAEGDVKPKAGVGCAIVEAPRGILYHCYELDDKGVVKKADIVTPTAHNAKNIDEDLKAYAMQIHGLPLEEATLKCETLVRAYDPCISCSVHITRLKRSFF
ncbi:Ni/Fe hydrogenase subunit alpha [Candidatus Bathyarchaeota archaeon]|nr:Ni/Fe hydrogenase subunit alpha [Candidatus Bathyarchaeota archaeon]